MNVFLTLLVPISLLFSIVSIVYFKLDYSFSEAIKIGLLSGILSATALSSVLALAIIIMRSFRKTEEHHSAFEVDLEEMEHDILHTHEEEVPPVATNHTHETYTQENIKPAKLDLEKPPTKSVENTPQKQEPINHKVMLLMDTELAFEVTTYAIKDQNIGKIISTDVPNGFIALRTDEENIQIHIHPLTKHTSQILIETIKGSKDTEKIISYLKEKEHSFLQY